MRPRTCYVASLPFLPSRLTYPSRGPSGSLLASFSCPLFISRLFIRCSRSCRCTRRGHCRSIPDIFTIGQHTEPPKPPLISAEAGERSRLRAIFSSGFCPLDNRTADTVEACIFISHFLLLEPAQRGFARYTLCHASPGLSSAIHASHRCVCTFPVHETDVMTVFSH